MEPLQVRPRLVIPGEEIRVAFARSGGPGGQNVNKVETRVELRFSVARSRVLSEVKRARLIERLGKRLTVEGVLIVRSSKTSKREQNLRDARERMAAILRDALAEAPLRRRTKATAASRRRRLESKRRHGLLKRDRHAGGGSD